MIYDGLAGLRPHQPRVQEGCYPAHADPIYVTGPAARAPGLHPNAIDAPCQMLEQPEEPAEAPEVSSLTSSLWCCVPPL